MAIVTIDVLVLGEALSELPEFANVVCARHGSENVWRVKKRLPVIMLGYLYCSGGYWAQALTMLILQAVLEMGLVRSGGPHVSWEV